MHCKVPSLLLPPHLPPTGNCQQWLGGEEGGMESPCHVATPNSLWWGFGKRQDRPVRQGGSIALPTPAPGTTAKMLTCGGRMEPPIMYAPPQLPLLGSCGEPDWASTVDHWTQPNPATPKIATWVVGVGELPSPIPPSFPHCTGRRQRSSVSSLWQPQGQGWDGAHQHKPQPSHAKPHAM